MTHHQYPSSPRLWHHHLLLDSAGIIHLHQAKLGNSYCRTCFMHEIIVFYALRLIMLGISISIKINTLSTCPAALPHAPSKSGPIRPTVHVIARNNRRRGQHYKSTWQTLHLIKINHACEFRKWCPES